MKFITLLTLIQWNLSVCSNGVGEDRGGNIYCFRTLCYIKKQKLKGCVELNDKYCFHRTPINSPRLKQ